MPDLERDLQPGNVETDGERKEKMSDEKFGRILSAVGNSELKAGIIAMMQPDFGYSVYKLHADLMRAQKNGGTGWQVSVGGPFQFCETTFAPIGLVVKEQVPYGNAEGLRYKLADDGIDLGKPLAGLLLHFSEICDRLPEKSAKSLYQYLGATHSSSQGEEKVVDGQTYQHKDRVPFLRYRIYYELTTAEKPLGYGELAKRVGASLSRVLDQLDELHDSNIVTFNKMEGYGAFSYFKYNATEQPDLTHQFGYYKTLTQRVYQVISEDSEKEWTTKDVVEAVEGIEKEEEPGKDVSQDNRYVIIGEVLRYFCKRGYASQKNLRYDPDSQVQLTDQQREPLVELVRILDSFQDQDSTILSEGKKFASEISGTPTRLAALLKKAKEHSPFANKTPVKEMNRRIVEVVTGHPDTSVRKVQDLIQSEFDKKMDVNSISRFLRNLARSGKLSSRIENGILLYSPPLSNNEESDPEDLEMADDLL